MNPEIEKIISSSQCNGGPFWSRPDGDIHAPSGYSTIDVINTLGNFGLKYTNHPILKRTVNFILSYFHPEGSFRYHPRSSRLPCMTARILTGLGRLGYRDKRIEDCYKRFLDTQEKDGGWRCATVKKGKSPATDASNPGTTLYVLDAFLYRKNNNTDTKKLNQAVAFLLKHWETKKPLGPCQFGIGTTFLKTEYPILRYNILYYCAVLSRYPKALQDRRYQEAAKLLKAKSVNGHLINENPHNKWRKFGFGKKGEGCIPDRFF